MKLKDIQAHIRSYEKAVSSPNISNNILGIPNSIYNNKAKRLLFLEWSFLKLEKKIYKSVLKLLVKIGEPIGGISDGGLNIPELYDLGFWDELKEYLITKFDFTGLKEKELIFTNPHFQEFFECKLSKFIPGYDNTRGRHISEVLLEGLKGGKLRSKRASKKMIVSFHDPCYLGRGLKIYDPPRSLLSLIDGVELREMDRNRKNSFCCGARAGNNYFPNFSRKTALERLKEFKKTGADFLITACPYCKVIFQKTLNKGKKDRVKDLAEFIEEHIE
jgi:Fe-S oxidoreductase